MQKHASVDGNRRRCRSRADNIRRLRKGWLQFVCLKSRVVTFRKWLSEGQLGLETQSLELPLNRRGLRSGRLTAGRSCCTGPKTPEGPSKNVKNSKECGFL